VAETSAGPHANHLHQTDNHTSTLSLNFLKAGCSSWCPTVSKHWRKFQKYDRIKCQLKYFLQQC